MPGDGSNTDRHSQLQLYKSHEVEISANEHCGANSNSFVPDFCKCKELPVHFSSNPSNFLVHFPLNSFKQISIHIQSKLLSNFRFIFSQIFLSDLCFIFLSKPFTQLPVHFPSIHIFLVRHSSSSRIFQ